MITPANNRRQRTASPPLLRGVVLMKITYISLVAALMLAGCAHRSPLSCFPPGVDQHYYAKHYAAMREKPIWPLTQAKPEREVYRYLSVPSWGNAQLIRIDVLQDGKTVTRVKETSGHDDSTAGALTVSRNVRIPESEFSVFTNLLDQSKFWSMPSETPIAPGVDGTATIMEVVRNGRYHVVTWSPREFGDYTLACIQLWRLAFPEDADPPAALYRENHDNSPPLPVDPDDMRSIAAGWKTEADVRAALGAPRAEDIDPKGKNSFFLFKDGSIISIRYDTEGSVVKRMYIPDQGYGQQGHPVYPR